MHILIFPSEEYIPTHAPRSNIFIHDQAKLLASKGITVGVISLTFLYSTLSLVKAVFFIKTKYTRHLSAFQALQILVKKIVLSKSNFISHEVIDGVNILRYDGFWGMRDSKKPLSHYNLWMKQSQYALNSYINKYGKPTIIHAHNMIYAGLTAINFQKKYSIPVMVTEHSSQYAIGKIPNELNEKLRIAFQQHHYIYAVSPQFIRRLENKYLKNHLNKVKWLPNVLDLNFEKGELPVMEEKKNKIRFLHVANLIPLKGQEDLIKAFSKAFKNTENVELLIGGAGYLKEELAQLIVELKLANKVKLIGLLNRDEIFLLMDKSDVFVLPSHSETFGVVLIEALSRGVPVISTTCGGPECIVDETNGILVEVKNSDQLAEALLKMYHHYDKYDSVLLRNSVISKFGNDAFYHKVRKIYQEILKP